MERTMKKMPKSVIVTVIATGLYLAVIAVSQVNLVRSGEQPTALPALIFFLISLVMFARGMRLGRPLLIFFLFLSLCGALAAIIVPWAKSGVFHLKSLLILLPISAPVVTAFIAILQRSAKEYSGYFCPACGSGKIKALDFMYNKAQCKDCGNIWY